MQMNGGKKRRENTNNPEDTTPLNWEGTRFRLPIMRSLSTRGRVCLLKEPIYWRCLRRKDRSSRKDWQIGTEIKSKPLTTSKNVSQSLSSYERPRAINEDLPPINPPITTRQ